MEREGVCVYVCVHAGVKKHTQKTRETSTQSKVAMDRQTSSHVQYA